MNAWMMQLLLAGVATTIVLAGALYGLVLAARKARAWWSWRRTARTAAQILDGVDLDLALEQLFWDEGCYWGEPDDLMGLADEVFRDGAE